MGKGLFSKIDIGIIDLMLLFTVCVWGVNPTIVKLGLNGIDNISFNILRLFIASIVCWIMLLSFESDWKIDRKDICGIVLVSILGHFIYQAFYINGIKLTTAGNASLIYGSLPAFIAFLNYFMKFEKNHKFTLIGILTSFIGMLIVIYGAGKGLSMNNDYILGNILIILATLSWALYTVLIKNYLKKYSATKIAAYGVTIGLFTMLIFWGNAIDIVTIKNLSHTSIYSILFSGAFAVGITTITWNRGVASVGSLRTSIYNNVTPVISVICGIMVLGEKFGLVQGLGSLLILFGLFLTKLRDKRQEAGIEKTNRKA
jgi:drug/metabolite transporter (DMT)-like permease